MAQTDITRTAHGEYGIDFPLAAKTQVKGGDAHPFYKWAAGERPLETPRWNFHKFLVGRDGHIAAVFPTDVEPMDARVINAIVKELPRRGINGVPGVQEAAAVDHACDRARRNARRIPQWRTNEHPRQASLRHRRTWRTKSIHSRGAASS